MGAAVAILILGLLATPRASAADIELPVAAPAAPIRIRAGGATHWPQGSYEVWVLRGDCRIEQGDVSARGSDAVLWIDRAEAYSGRPSKVIAYVEGNVIVNFGRRGDPHSISRRESERLETQSWLGRFHTTAGIELAVPVTGAEPSVKPAIFERGLKPAAPSRACRARRPASPVRPRRNRSARRSAQWPRDRWRLAIASASTAAAAAAGTSPPQRDEDRNERIVFINIADHAATSPASTNWAPSRSKPIGP